MTSRIDWSRLPSLTWQACRQALWDVPPPRGMRPPPAAVPLPADWAVPALWRRQRSPDTLRAATEVWRRFQ